MLKSGGMGNVFTPLKDMGAGRGKVRKLLLCLKQEIQTSDFPIL